MARLSIYAVAAALAIVAGAVTAQPTELAEPSAALRGGRTLQAQGPNTFFAPRVSGFRVDYCLGFDANLGPNNPAAFRGCGQPAADAFCRAMGFPAGAQAFDQVNGITESTVFMETMTPSIQGLSRVSFNFITCRGGPGGNQMPMGGIGGSWGGVGGPMGPVGGVGMRDFFQPRAASGKRVDHCAAFNPNLPGHKANQMAYQGCGQPAADIFCRNNGFQRAIHFETVDGVNEPSEFLATPQNWVPAPHRAFSVITCGN